MKTADVKKAAAPRAAVLMRSIAPGFAPRAQGTEPAAAGQAPNGIKPDRAVSGQRTDLKKQ
jgi:hypothetical protein